MIRNCIIKITCFHAPKIEFLNFIIMSQVACVVIRTGFATQKGQLIRSIMYPKEVDFKFYLDSMKFVFMLFVVALFGTAYSIYLYIVRGVSIQT